MADTSLALLLAKATATPILIALITLAIRRWGNTIGGLITGLPFMAGPVLLFLAIEQGPAFAVEASTGILLAVLAVTAYTLSFIYSGALLALPLAVLVSALAYGASAWLTGNLEIDLLTAASIAATGNLIALLVVQRPREAVLVRRMPWWDIPLRMIVAAVLIMAVTMLAERLGARWSGIVGAFPVMSGILSGFTLYWSGPQAVRSLLRGQLASMFGFIVFFLTVGLTIEGLGIAASFTLAVATSVATSVVITTIDRLISRIVARTA